jgi:hypothetical protein
LVKKLKPPSSAAATIKSFAEDGEGRQLIYKLLVHLDVLRDLGQSEVRVASKVAVSCYPPSNFGSGSRARVNVYFSKIAFKCLYELAYHEVR